MKKGKKKLLKRIIPIFMIVLLVSVTIPTMQCYAYVSNDNKRPDVLLQVDDKWVKPQKTSWDSSRSFEHMIKRDSVWNKIQISNNEYANSITLDNNPVYSGDYVYAPNLASGINIYTIQVDNNKYNLNIYKEQPSEFYNLIKVYFSGDINVDFKPNQYEYNITVPSNLKNTNIMVWYQGEKTNNVNRNVSINNKGIFTETIDLTTGECLGCNFGVAENLPINKGLNVFKIEQEVYAFGDVIETKTYVFNITITEPTNETPSGGGGGGGGISSTPSSNIVLEATTDKANATVVSVPQDKLTSLFKLLETKNDSVKIAVIEVPKKGSLNNYKIELPTTAFNGKNETGITIDTKVGSLTLMDTMLQDSLIENVSKIEMNICDVDKSTLSKEVLNMIGNKPIVSLNVALDGKRTAWNNPNSPVIVSIPYMPTAEELNNPEKIVVYYIDGENNLNVVSNAKYSKETGEVVFSTTHFSNYAIGYNNKTFNDISSSSAKHAIEVLASKGIINGKTQTEFKPNDNLTRAEFMTILTRAFSLNKTFNDNFIDVKSDKYYYNSVGITKSLGIINGVDEKHFNPNGLLTKEHVEIITNKLKNIEKIDTNKVNKGLSKIQSDENVTREEISLMLYELIK